MRTIGDKYARSVPKVDDTIIDSILSRYWYHT